MYFRKLRLPVIETERLVLRMWQRKDAKDLFAYAKDPEVGPKAGWKPHTSIGESKNVIEYSFIGTMTWAITIKGEDKPIGSIGLSPDKYRENVINSRELGYSLSRQYWGQGIMAEAIGAVIRYGFDVINLEMIIARTNSVNEASKRVLEKCGFAYEGTLRKAYRYYDGSVMDISCFSLARDDVMNSHEE